MKPAEHFFDVYLTTYSITSSVQTLKPVSSPNYRFCRRVFKKDTNFVQQNQKECNAVIHQRQERLHQKAKTSPLHEKSYCYVLQSEADHQGSKTPSRAFRWIGPYVVEKVWPNESYMVRKLNTNKRQLLHCIRLRTITTETPLEDN